MADIKHLSDSLFYELANELKRRASPIGEWEDGLELQAANGDYFLADDIQKEVERRRQDFWIEMALFEVRVVEPPIKVYQVSVYEKGQVYHESFGSRELVRAFLLGLKVARANLNLLLFLPPIPEDQ